MIIQNQNYFYLLTTVISKKTKRIVRNFVDFDILVSRGLSLFFFANLLNVNVKEALK